MLPASCDQRPKWGKGLVWGFSLSSGVFRFIARFFVRIGKGLFSIPSPTIRFPERAERGQGTETLAKFGALPPSGACVWQRLDAGARGGRMNGEGAGSEGGSPSRAEPRATHLYSVDPMRIRTMMVIRIGGEAPGRRTHSKPRHAGHVQYRVAATSDRHRQSVNTGGLQKPLLAGAITRPREGASLTAPRQWSPVAKARSGACERALRSWSCASRYERLPFVLDTTWPTRCPSGAPGNPRRSGASHGARGRCRI